jgi:hypothetical protein
MVTAKFERILCKSNTGSIRSFAHLVPFLSDLNKDVILQIFSHTGMQIVYHWYIRVLNHIIIRVTIVLMNGLEWLLVSGFKSVHYREVHSDKSL